MNISYSFIIAVALFALLLLFPPIYRSYDIATRGVAYRRGGKLVLEVTQVEIQPIWYRHIKRAYGTYAESAGGVVIIKVDNEGIAFPVFGAALAGIILISLFLGILTHRKEPLLRVFFIISATSILLIVLFAPHREDRTVFEKGTMLTEEATEFRPAWKDLQQSLR